MRVRMMSLCVVSLWVGVRAYKHVCICISTCTCMRMCVCARVLRLVKAQCFLFCRLVLLWSSQRWEQTEKRAKKNIEMERKRRKKEKKKEAKPNSLQVTELHVAPVSKSVSLKVNTGPAPSADTCLSASVPCVPGGGVPGTSGLGR